MARPSPITYNEIVNKKTYIKTAIVAGMGIYFVTYNGNVFNLKITNTLVDTSTTGKPLGPKYGRTSFVHRGHADRAAAKLNKMFNTDKFKVARVTGFMYE